MWNLQSAEVASWDHDSIKMALWDVFSMVCYSPLPLGCKVLCYPSTFNMTTGPAHWEILVRSRYTYILLVQQSSLVGRPRPAFHRFQYGSLVSEPQYMYAHVFSTTFLPLMSCTWDTIPGPPHSLCDWKWHGPGNKATSNHICLSTLELSHRC